MRNLSIRLGWGGMLAAIILCAAAIAFSALASIPIEAHEAFVLLAAQHMRDTGDWVIPYFNGEPHLTKPPLNYWLTAIVSHLAGGDQILAWHGRLPSALGGIGLVAATAYAARKLFDARVGLLAAAITATCSGFFYYTHTARPEMLYAFLCALAMTAYVHIREDGERRPATAFSIWILFGLATLCKGPQLPVMLLVAFVIDQYWLGHGFRQGMSILRPLRGLLLMALIALPWWWLLDHRLGGSGLKGTQLSGTLLHVNPLRHLSLYYLYRPLQLLLPWIVFLPTLKWIGRQESQGGRIKLLALLVVLPAVILTFGPQKRWYYMLPSMLPMVTVLAAGIVAWSENKSRRIPVALGAVFTVLVLAFVAAGMIPRLWGAGRFSHAELAQVMKYYGADGTPQVSWGVTPEVFAFYSGRIVRVADTSEQILTEIDTAPEGKIVLLLEAKNEDKLPPGLKTEILGRAVGDADDEPAMLLMVERP